LAKIADEVDRALAERDRLGSSGRPKARVLACGDGWTVADVVCASRAHDRPFEEQHSQFSIAIVAAGTFQYRSTLGSALMTPGSLMLGSWGQRFECEHRHGAGDRCVAFWYDPAYFERIAPDVGVHGNRLDFRLLRVPPVRGLSPLIALACSGITGSEDVSWNEIGIQLAARTVQLTAGAKTNDLAAPKRAIDRVAHIVRAINRGHLDAGLGLDRLARAAELSPYHFLRTFQRVTGVTPHQYVMRARLREAARRLVTERRRILDIALDCGFGDVSNFNHAFRAEFGKSPRRFRAS
jgi:AraC family transcriptional regulator